MGLERAGAFKTVAFSEIEPHACKVLARHWPNTPNHGDIRQLNDQITEPVDVICGGFPCQDISLANSGSMVGIEGKKSSLWSEFYKQIRRHDPTFCVIENSPVLRRKGLDRILSELSAVGHDAEWHCIPATAVDAPHSRDRVWIISYPAGLGDRLPEGQILTRRHFVEYVHPWPTEPGVCRVANGIPDQTHRHKCLGNTVVPSIPEIIGHAITEAARHTNH